MGEWFRWTKDIADVFNAYIMAGQLANKNPSYDFRVMIGAVTTRWYVAARLKSNPQVMLWEYAR
jgi:hypothetical protein